MRWFLEWTSDNLPVAWVLALAAVLLTMALALPLEVLTRPRAAAAIDECEHTCGDAGVRLVVVTDAETRCECGEGE